MWLTQGYGACDLSEAWITGSRTLAYKEGSEDFFQNAGFCAHPRVSPPRDRTRVSGVRPKNRCFSRAPRRIWWRFESHFPRGPATWNTELQPSCPWPVPSVFSDPQRKEAQHNHCRGCLQLTKPPPQTFSQYCFHKTTKQNCNQPKYPIRANGEVCHPTFTQRGFTVKLMKFKPLLRPSVVLAVGWQSLIFYEICIRGKHFVKFVWFLIPVFTSTLYLILYASASGPTDPVSRKHIETEDSVPSEPCPKWILYFAQQSPQDNSICETNTFFCASKCL